MPFCFYSLYWLSEKMDWYGLLDGFRSLSNGNRGRRREVDSHLPVPYTVLKSAK